VWIDNVGIKMKKCTLGADFNPNRKTIAQIMDSFDGCHGYGERRVC
jgi:hypothetical protein